VPLAAFWLFFALYLFRADAFGRRIIALAPRGQISPVPRYMAELRGGATPAVDEEDEEEEESEEEEEEVSMGKLMEFDDEEEEEDDGEEFDAALAASAVKASAKTKAKIESSKTSTAKKAVSAKLSSKTPKKKRSNGLLKNLRVPYIIRACLNPGTAFAMTRAFWASLFNLDYLKQVSWMKKKAISSSLCSS